VNEGLVVPKIEEASVAPEDVPLEENPASDSQAPESTGPFWLRLAYAFEFLIAVLAIFTVWSQVGGQGHLDLLPWYVKLSTALALAWSTIRFTSGLVEHPQKWNRHSGVWLGAILLLAIMMASITYYYHLHEVPDETDEETTAASASLSAPYAIFTYSERTSC
jgi:hypothetical protein